MPGTMRSSLFAFLGAFSLLATACAGESGDDGMDSDSSGSNFSQAETAGIPKFYMGTHDNATDLLTFEAGGQQDYYSLISAGNFQGIPNTGGAAAYTPLDCQTAELWATSTTTFPTGKRCAVELLGTGRLTRSLNGVALHIIPLGPSGLGFDEASYREVVDPLSPGELRKVTSGPPDQPNMGLDEQPVLAAMIETKDQFRNVAYGEMIANTQDCLKNARAAQWNDLQAHYYCQLPYTIRYCYSSVLAESRDPVKALSYCSDPANKDDWQSKNDPMFHSYGPAGSDQWTNDWQWLKDPTRLGVFKYVMFTASGKRDFNLEQQNKVVNDFYAAAGTPRPRRAVDTYPAWSAKQPRYEQLRCVQAPATQGCAGR
jgi:hypothetical protein